MLDSLGRYHPEDNPFIKRIVTNRLSKTIHCIPAKSGLW